MNLHALAPEPKQLFRRTTTAVAAVALLFSLFVAAELFANELIVVKTASGAMPRSFLTALIIRELAWCGTKRSTSSG